MQSISCNEFHNEIISGTFKLRTTTPSLDGEEDVRIHQEINVALIFIKENSILMPPRTSTNKYVRKRKEDVCNSFTNNVFYLVSVHNKILYCDSIGFH